RQIGLLALAAAYPGRGLGCIPRLHDRPRTPVLRGRSGGGRAAGLGYPCSDRIPVDSAADRRMTRHAPAALVLTILLFAASVEFVGADDRSRSGKISHMGPGYPDSYLALPIGR